MNLQNPKVARVTSLDPAEFMYDLSDLDDTIDPSDAEFVDVLHTSWVSRVPKGHVDFYPNNGDTGHMMAVYYYTDSIKAKCRYTSYKCTNWKDFEAGKCATDCSNNSCNEMGHYASPDKARGRVYINVKDDAPYCR
ncbi:unnamed protein product [Owenia fusiformis]|uniref:Uncharacterized protein n=1 Tax=Owenia fusiformis TaxID=6347 RepID=A0A8J1TXK2_OWEFU|nr:unnamed protein product [Owenia fusiformis]